MIPCRPATFDLDAIGATVDMAKLANVSAVVIFNAVPTRGTLADEAKAVVAGYGVPVAPVHMHQRAAYAQVGLSTDKTVNRATGKKRVPANVR